MPNFNLCPFCHEDSEGYKSMIGPFYISNPFSKGKYYLNGGKLKPRKINYCPMCGRSFCAGGGTEMSEWISVKDRLPGQSGEYLVLVENGDMFNAEFDECCGECGEFGIWQGWYDPNTLGFVDSEWSTYSGITHWMPLPEAPKEGEQA